LKKILVTGAGGPASINFVMSLRLAAEKVAIVGSDSNKHYVHLSCADKNYLVPKANSSAYINELNRIIAKEKISFVHPQPDIEVAVVSEQRERLKANVFLPSRQAIQICQDKFASAKKWRSKGIPVAKFLELRNESDVDKAFQQLGSPLWIRATQGAGGRGSTPADKRETAIAWIEYWKSRCPDWKFIAQEHLPGRNIGFHSLWKDGELVTSMSRERLEYIYPHLAPSGVTGTPSIQRTIHSKTANKTGTEAVLAIDPEFNGIACVDLKENSKGEPQVTEINPGRMFTTSFFFSYASKILRKDNSANIPYLYVKLAYDETLPEIPKYDVLPANLYWIRHIDAPAKLVKDGKVLGAMYR
jgi:carbamoyl-phosphate synthase large subunit